MSKKQIEEIVKDLESETLRPDLVQDNKIIFYCNDKVLRVRMPNEREILIAREKKNQYEISLLNQENTLTLKQLKKLLKTKDVDIDAMEKELKAIENKSLRVYEKLVKRSDKDEDGIESDKKELEDIKQERDVIINEISTRISPSIDVQAENYYMSYLTSICIEQNLSDEPPTWSPLWNSFDEYLKEESTDTKFYCMGYLTQLMMKVK